MASRDHQPVGFDVENSPFSLLRDSTNWMFSDLRLGLGDVATGYIYLAPLEKIHQCDWIEGYITQSQVLALFWVSTATW